MPEIQVILGPPGTGKTTTIMNRIDALLASGVPANEIGFYSFTKAACREAKDRAADRFNLDPDGPELDNFRTIHSQAFRFVGRGRGTVMIDRHWKQFSEWSRCQFSETDMMGGEGLFLPVLVTDGDKLRHIWDLVRLCRCSPAKAMLRVTGIENVSESDVLEFARKLDEFKQQEKLIEFVDMLTLAAGMPNKLAVRYAFFDESQDNCQLQWDLLRHWAIANDRCQEVTIAGDDDQAIYTFAGAEPDNLIAAARQHPTRQLEQSHRIPASVHGMASRIIRQNRNRIDKVYRPRAEAGELLLTSEPGDHLDAHGGSVLAIVRNNMFAKRYYAECMARGIRFTAEVGTAAPLQSEADREAFGCVAAWRSGRAARAPHFARLLKVVPAKDGDTVLRPHGALARAERNETNVTPERAISEFGLTELVTRVRGRDPFGDFKLLERPERDYLGRILGRDPFLTKPSVVTLTNIHKSKGREADTVLINSDVAGATHREIASGSEGENRAAYVAATRARKRLVVVRPETHRSYDYERHMGNR